MITSIEIYEKNFLCSCIRQRGLHNKPQKGKKQNISQKPKSAPEQPSKLPMHYAAKKVTEKSKYDNNYLLLNDTSPDHQDLIETCALAESQ